MIIPRTVSPSPVPSFGGLEVLDDLSQEDINRLAKERLAEIKVSDTPAKKHFESKESSRQVPRHSSQIPPRSKNAC